MRFLTAIAEASIVRAEYRKFGQIDWLSIDGEIGTDGKTALGCNGPDGGRPQYASGHPKAGTPYTFTVDAQFRQLLTTPHCAPQASQTPRWQALVC